MHLARATRKDCESQSFVLVLIAPEPVLFEYLFNPVFDFPERLRAYDGFQIGLDGAFDAQGFSRT